MQRSLIKLSVAFIFSLLIVAVLILILPNVSFAQNSDQNLSDFANSAGIETTSSLPTIIGRIVQVFLAVLGIILILLIIYGGWIWMSSAGDPAKIEKAKKIIINAIIGVIVVSLAFAIATFVMNALSGTGIRGGRGSVIPGGPNDWNRSMIGRGPIESVYPTPNQRDVSIDTQIVVSFKEAIDAATIYDLATNKILDNIEICQVDDKNYNCIASSTFDATDFANSTANSTPDNKTFVFTPNKYLGLADSGNRIFKVKLKSGIEKISGESVFKGGYYEWVFETNGKLDLNPPKIVAANVYPTPDDQSDSYSLVDKPSTGQSSIVFSSADISPELPLRMGSAAADMSAFIGQPLAVEIKSQSAQIPSEHKVYLKTDSGFELSAPSTPVQISFTVNGDATKVTLSSANANVLKLPSATLSISGNRINFGNGLYVETNGGPFVQGSSWDFYLANKDEGKTFIVKSNNAEYNYLFVNDSETRTSIARSGKDYFAVKSTGVVASTVKNLADKINSTASQLVVAGNSGGILDIQAKLAGGAGNAIQIGKTSSALQFLTGGVSQAWGRNTAGANGALDPYNNSLFQITFDKPINPISLNPANVIVRYDSDQNGSLDTVIQASSSISNQYKTITLRGPFECGKNSCGESITCWMPVNSALPTSTKFEIELAAAKLKVCSGSDNGWCGNSGSDSAGFGGSCTTGSRCSKNIGGQTVFYPKTGDASSGIADLSGNSFNGNFNSYSYTSNGSAFNLGISEGRSGNPTSDGFSGMNPFVLIDSKPIAAPTLGDNIRWNFFLSSEIDVASPLIKSIFPIGGQEFGIIDGEQSNQPVEVQFDRLMDSSSFRPGWGYATSTAYKEWFDRYFVLSTINSGANPIGYWLGKTEGDGDNDGWSDYTRALIYHNNFDNSVQYGPLAGSAIRSITQNCFLPGSGPKYAGDTIYNSNATNTCAYESRSSTSTIGCVSDTSLGDAKVNSNNPASYAHMKCAQIEGAVECAGTKTCKPFYEGAGVNVAGSWVITIDHPTSISGRTGCCFGKCQ